MTLAAVLKEMERDNLFHSTSKSGASHYYAKEGDKYPLFFISKDPFTSAPIIRILGTVEKGLTFVQQKLLSLAREKKVSYSVDFREKKRKIQPTKLPKLDFSIKETDLDPDEGPILTADSSLKELREAAANKGVKDAMKKRRSTLVRILALDKEEKLSSIRERIEGRKKERNPNISELNENSSLIALREAARVKGVRDWQKRRRSFLLKELGITK